LHSRRNPNAGRGPQARPGDVFLPQYASRHARRGHYTLQAGGGVQGTDHVLNGSDKLQWAKILIRTTNVPTTLLKNVAPTPE
jgi:hypothetical protein